eukprot:CAMPEP_0198689506 /NCGR_PEP_ID=MMETSP1468-20131203/143302_1 /TAXON_ID=1461545 /ORGANISM="Mantoniella sp, Strain CCMP1436" /LENGTH=142 /DNA_ID=CAMNT_0044440617 /DNA_START=204 /DNA_END=634 /DNA_ORIENTATION=-
MATRLTDLKWRNTYAQLSLATHGRGLEYLRDHRRGSVAVTLQTRRLDHRPTQGAGALPFEPLPYALLAEDMCAPQLDGARYFSWQMEQQSPLSMTSSALAACPYCACTLNSACVAEYSWRRRSMTALHLNVRYSPVVMEENR